MKDQILKVIRDKKTLFKQEVNEGIAELQKIKAEANQKEKREGMLMVMERIPLLKTKIVSAKVVIAVLTELEKEVSEVKVESNETVN